MLDENFDRAMRVLDLVERTLPRLPEECDALMVVTEITSQDRSKDKIQWYALSGTPEQIAQAYSQLDDREAHPNRGVTSFLDSKLTMWGQSINPVPRKYEEVVASYTPVPNTPETAEQYQAAQPVALDISAINARIPYKPLPEHSVDLN